MYRAFKEEIDKMKIINIAQDTYIQPPNFSTI
jgi:hypothetical protein